MIHECAGLRRRIPQRFSYRVGVSGARKIAVELAQDYGDGTYRFIRYVGEFKRSRNGVARPSCKEICRIGVERGVVAAVLGPDRPAIRPCDEFFSY